MAPPINYTREEENALAHALRQGRDPTCPRCQVPLSRSEVGRRPGVSYVRDRIWLRCPDCRRSVVLDRRRVE
jgi:endogenous inhibitor of DNA gyrase (YacG/DUF329 family)